MTQDAESPDTPPEPSAEPEGEDTELEVAFSDLWSSLKRIGRVVRKEMAHPARTAVKRVAGGADAFFGGLAGDESSEKNPQGKKK